MKTLKIFTTALLIVFASTSCTGQDRVIKTNDLPSSAQTMVENNFKGKQMTLVQKDVEGLRTYYDVILDDGTKIEFDSKGEWTEIDCKPHAVPSALIPSGISDYAKQNFATAKIVQIERDKRGYEIDLSNGIEISFDKKFKVRKFDD